MDCGAGGACSHGVGETVTGQYACACDAGYEGGGSGGPGAVRSCSTVPCPAHSTGASVLEGCICDPGYQFGSSGGGPAVDVTDVDESLFLDEDLPDDDELED